MTDDFTDTVPNPQDIVNSLNRSETFRRLPAGMQSVYFGLATVLWSIAHEHYEEHATLENMLSIREKFVEYLYAHGYDANFAASAGDQSSPDFDLATMRTSVDGQIYSELQTVREQMADISQFDSRGKTYRDRIVAVLGFNRKQFKKMRAGMLTVGDFINTEAFPLMDVRL